MITPIIMIFPRMITLIIIIRYSNDNFNNNDRYPNEYVPTAIDTYHAVVHVDGQPLTLELCDTPGQVQIHVIK